MADAPLSPASIFMRLGLTLVAYLMLIFHLGMVALVPQAKCSGDNPDIWVVTFVFAPLALVFALLHPADLLLDHTGRSTHLRRYHGVFQPCVAAGLGPLTARCDRHRSDPDRALLANGQKPGRSHPAGTWISIAYPSPHRRALPFPQLSTRNRKICQKTALNGC